MSDRHEKWTRLTAKLAAQPNGCIAWTGYTNGGYGQLMVGGRTYRAHRLAWELEHGPIPDGLLVCHTCDNPSCCNVDHLFLGTDLDNNRDKERKRRGGNSRKTHCPQGHPYDEANTHVTPKGWRECKTCMRQWRREWRQQREATA